MLCRLSIANDNLLTILKFMRNYNLRKRSYILEIFRPVSRKYIY